MTSQEITTIISALALAIVQIILALKSNANVEVMKKSQEHNANRAEGKLDAIHDLTNSNLAAVTSDLALANDRIEKLDKMLEMVVTGSGNSDIKAALVSEIIKTVAKVKDIAIGNKSAAPVPDKGSI